MNALLKNMLRFSFTFNYRIIIMDTMSANPDRVKMSHLVIPNGMEHSGFFTAFKMTKKIKI